MTRPPIHCVVAGEGPGVLLLHGLGGDHQQALGLLPADHPTTRIAPDLPGHGGTDLVDGEPLSFTAYAELVADLLDTLRAEGRRPEGPVAVVGVSMGARIAVTLADRRPGLVDRLVLVRPAWLDIAPPPNLAPFPLIGRLIDTLGLEAGAAAFRDTPEYLTCLDVAPAMAASLLGQFSRPYAIERSRVLVDLPNSLPLPNQAAYRSLDVDTLVVAAPDDPVHDDQIARVLRNWIPGARLATVPRKRSDPTEHNLAVRAVVASALTATTLLGRAGVPAAVAGHPMKVDRAVVEDGAHHHREESRR